MYIAIHTQRNKTNITIYQPKNAICVHNITPNREKGKREK